MENQYETTNMPHQYKHQHKHQQHHQQMSSKTMLFAILFGITIGGPLLAIMSFIFIATMTLLVVTSPLLIIFSPIIVGAGFVFVAALAGLSAAGLTGIAGLLVLSWVFRSFKGGQIQQGIGSTAGKIMDYGERAAGKLVDYGENVKENVKDTGKDFASNLKQTVQNPDNRTTTNKT